MNPTSQALRTSGLIQRLRHLCRSANPPITAEAFHQEINSKYLAPTDQVAGVTVERLLYGEKFSSKSGTISSETALAIIAYLEDKEKPKTTAKKTKA